MDWAYVLDFIYEISYFLSVFGVFMIWATFKGRQAMINLIFGLYFALLISIHFPYTDYLTNNLGSGLAQAIGELTIFVIFTILTTWLAARVMPDEFRERKFETLHKKFLLAGAGAILVMAFSFHVLPVTEFLTPGTPLQSLFGPESYFFWWLLLPLVVLFIL